MKLFAPLLTAHPFSSVSVRGWPTELLENHVFWGYLVIPTPHLLHVQNTKGICFGMYSDQLSSSLPGCTSWESLQTAKCSSINIEKGRNQGGNAGMFLPDVWLQHQASPGKALTSVQWVLCTLTRWGTRPDQAIKAASQLNIFCKLLHPWNVPWSLACKRSASFYKKAVAAPLGLEWCGYPSKHAVRAVTRSKQHTAFLPSSPSVTRGISPHSPEHQPSSFLLFDPFQEWCLGY